MLAAISSLRTIDHFDPAVEVTVMLSYALTQRGRLQSSMLPLARLLAEHTLQLRPRFALACLRMAAERNGSQPPPSPAGGWGGGWDLGVCIVAWEWELSWGEFGLGGN